MDSFRFNFSFISSFLLKASLVVFILALSSGQVGRLPFSGMGGNAYVSDALLFVLWLAWVFWAVKNWHRVSSLSVSHLFFLGSLFALWSLLTLTISYNTFGEAVLSQGVFYWARWVLYFSLLPIVYTFVSLDREGVRFVFLSFSVCFLLFALFGFIQLAVFPDFTLMALAGGWDPHKNRLLSTFFDPNFAGAFLGLGLLLILPQVLARLKCCFSKKQVLVVIMLVLVFALLLTFSRSAWGLVAVGVGVIGVLKYRWLLVVGAALALGAYFFIPRVQTRLAGITDPADSASHRLVSWRKTLEIHKSYSWWGVGFGNFRLAQKDNGYFLPGEWGGRSGAGSDSSILLVLATTGPVGLVLYLVMYGHMLYRSWLVFRRSQNPRRQALALSLLAILAGLLLESNFINSLFYPQIMAFLWVLAGLVFSLSVV